MFGNAYIDFCLANYAELVQLATSNSPAIKHLRAEAKMFASAYQYMDKRRGKNIPLAEFTAIGIDYQTLALTVFLIAFKDGFKNVSMNADFVLLSPPLVAA
jgi:hypothetical protein